MAIIRTCELTPGCENQCEGNTLGCASCNHAARKAEKQAKKFSIAQPVKKITAKRAGQNQEYFKLRKEYLELYPVCEVPECNLKATEIHHQRGRENERLLDTNYFMAVCHKHHGEFHSNSKEAREKGYSVLRGLKN